MNTRFEEKPLRGSSEAGTHCLSSSYGVSRTILLISNDKQLLANLRLVANIIGLFVIKAAQTSGTVPILQATRPAAVLLDLDLPHEAAWPTGELVLNEPVCPAVILLSGRTTQFDMRTAIRAGSLVSKRESPDRLLQIIKQRLELPQENQAERNAIQRVLLRWLKPSGWGQPSAPAHRFWGIND